MILTFDIGSTDTKVALVNNDYRVEWCDTVTTDYSTLTQRIQELSSDHSPEQIGIATGLAFSRENSVFWVEDSERINVLHADEAWLYNDAEAAAFSLNLPIHSLSIQTPTGNQNSIADKALVYLGTGFQFVPTVLTTSGVTPRYTLGCLMHVAENIVFGEERRALAKANGIHGHELRMSHLLSSRGLCAVNEIVTGKVETVQEIIGTSNQSTFHEYSKYLGRALREMMTGCSCWGGLVLGGTFASAISNHIDPIVVKQEFNDVGDIFKPAMASIPLSVFEDSYSANKGIAYCIRNNIESSVYAIE